MIRLAVEILVLFWFITLPLVLLGAALIVTGLIKGQRPTAQDSKVALAPVLLSMLIFPVGILFEQTGYGWENWLLDGLLIMQVVVSGYLILRVTSHRWLVAGAHVLILTFSLGAWFVSGMMITGGWL